MFTSGEIVSPISPDAASCASNLIIFSKSLFVPPNSPAYSGTECLVCFATFVFVGDIVYTKFGLKIRTRVILLSTLHVECVIPNFKSRGPRLPWFISPTRFASSI